MPFYFRPAVIRLWAYLETYDSLDFAMRKRGNREEEQKREKGNEMR